MLPPPRLLCRQAVVSLSIPIKRESWSLSHVAGACRRVFGVRPLPAGASLGRSGCVATRANIITCSLVRPCPHHSSRDRVRGASPASWGPSSALQHVYPSSGRSSHHPVTRCVTPLLRQEGSELLIFLPSFFKEGWREATGWLQAFGVTQRRPKLVRNHHGIKRQRRSSVTRL
jgi:hypothetical protein